MLALRSESQSRKVHQTIDIILDDIKVYYPKFDKWYQYKVVPGLISGERKIIYEFRDSKIAGVAIVKDTTEEKKICTIKVLPPYEKRGIGVKLFKRAMQSLNTATPIATVPEERYEEFHKLFSKYNFKLTQILDGYYRKGKKEFVYNGKLI